MAIKFSEDDRQKGKAAVYKVIVDNKIVMYTSNKIIALRYYKALKNELYQRKNRNKNGLPADVDGSEHPSNIT